MATKLARHLVSKQKRRFQEDGFDLDLSYITESIIAMGIPESGVEGKFRNPIEEVIRFFETYHPQGAKIYNLCIESDRQYDVDNFSGSVASFPFYDHNCPPLVLIPAFCASAKSWLQSGIDHVVAVHCKAGKSRTGLMLCCLLLHIQEQIDPDACIKFYGQRRTHDGKGVTIPSQRRYINYYRVMLNVNMALPKPLPAPPVPQARTMRITSVHLFDVPKRFAQEANTLQFTVGDHGSLDKKTGINLYESWSHVGGAGGGARTETVMEETVGGSEGAAGADERYSRAIQSICFSLSVPVTEDFKLLFFAADKEGKRHKLFYTWAHTSFMPEPAEPGAAVKYVVYRDQCDKFANKKKWDANFRLEVTLEDRSEDGEIIPREAECEEEQLFRKHKVSFDKWVADDLIATRHASVKSKKKGAGAPAIVDPAEELEQRSAEAQAAEELLVSNAAYVQSIKSLCINFAENVVLNGTLPFIDAKKDWGTYQIEGLELAEVTMNPEELAVDCCNGLRVYIRGISARCEGFQWSFERSKMPKASDACDADATLGFAIEFVLPVVAVGGTIEVGKCDVSISVASVDLCIRGKHTWVYKRLLGLFERNVRDSVEQALQDLANSTKGLDELAIRIASATTKHF